MRRASAVKLAGTWAASTSIGRVLLDANNRNRRRVVLTAEDGTQFLLDLPQPIALRHGDGLVLDNGAIIAVTGVPERLSEIDPGAHADLVHLAWHLGNRHTEIQIVGGRLRIRRDHVLEAMVRSFGAIVTALEAPFDPEPGAHG
jgi:urease accessory protein